MLKSEAKWAAHKVKPTQNTQAAHRESLSTSVSLTLPVLSVYKSIVSLLLKLLSDCFEDCFEIVPIVNPCLEGFRTTWFSF